MPRFARMLADGMRARGHQVSIRAPKARFVRLPLPRQLRKWLGYLDQYLVFPTEVRKELKPAEADTLFVFTDQALGPWIPLVANRPHVIHCHDFLAQRSALGEIPENPTSWTGRHYQAYIRRGYAKGRHFISVSHATRQALHHFLPAPPARSEVVYNGLNQTFAPGNVIEARTRLSRSMALDLRSGYLLHVGGNQWYKNRVGVIELYTAWRAQHGPELPLLLIGQVPDTALLEAWQHSAFKDSIYIVNNVDDESVRLAYVGATVFLFPSLAEGFGWPIAEAMASGCPVITTAEAPMTEVGGTAAFYLPRRPAASETDTWASAGAHLIQQVVELGLVQRQEVVEAGVANARRFEAEQALNQIETIYQDVLTKAAQS